MYHIEYLWEATEYFENNWSEHAMDLQGQYNKVNAGLHPIRPWTWKRQNNLESDEAVDRFNQAAFDNDSVWRSEVGPEILQKRG